MRVNESLAISTRKVLLVPYEAHHVVRYHGWMQDPDIQEATASEPLSLDEEFENQQSWRTSHDKLTFILAEPLSASHSLSEAGTRLLKARAYDSELRTKGDVNFFLYPHDDDDEEDEEEEESEKKETREMLLRGEVDVMVAEKDARRNGMGSAAVRALIVFVRRHVKDIFAEYARGYDNEHQHEHERQRDPTFRLTSLMAKIKQDNVGSRALFETLGFEQLGGVDYFGEVKMVLDWEAVDKGGRWDEEIGYDELGYQE